MNYFLFQNQIANYDNKTAVNLIVYMHLQGVWSQGHFAHLLHYKYRGRQVFIAFLYSLVFQIICPPQPVAASPTVRVVNVTKLPRYRILYVRTYYVYIVSCSRPVPVTTVLFFRDRPRDFVFR